MQIKQTIGLTYRKIDDNYYVTNSLSHEVIVLNELAFRILEIADNCGLDDVCFLLSGQANMVENSQHHRVSLSREEVMSFLEELRNLGLIKF